MDWPGDGSLVATCGGGAEEALEQEITDLGMQALARENGIVRFSGRAPELVRANQELRTASRVLVPLAQGAVRGYDDLYRLARSVPWATLVPPEKTIAVTAVVRDRRLPDHRLAALRIKDAIVDAQRAKGRRSSVDRRHPDVPVVLFAADGKAEISLDSSGAPLHERGYRREAGEAPLRETVAAAMLRYSGWNPGTPLLDPFCGSGTIVIEAAMMAAGRAPGDIREGYAYAAWPWFQLGTQQRRTSSGSRGVRTAGEATAGATGALIVGRDTDESVLRIAARNAERAGVDQLIRFEHADARTEAPPEDSGIIATNPPYGERLALDEARSFYRELGQHLKTSYTGWSCYLLSANREAMKGVGLRASSRRQLWNGGLDARLYAFAIYPPRDDRPTGS